MNLEKLFNTLNEEEVRYLLIGGMASILYGVPRTSIDFDIAIDPAAKNVKKTIVCLKKLGLSCDTENTTDILAQGGITFSNDMEIDVLTDLPGKDGFVILWARRNKVTYEGTEIDVISKEDQIRILREVGRKQDIDDADILARE